MDATDGTAGEFTSLSEPVSNLWGVDFEPGDLVERRFGRDVAVRSWF